MNTVYSDNRVVNSGALTPGLGFPTYLRAHHFTSLVTFATEKQE